MNEYLLDANVVIGLWNKSPFIINKLIEGERIKILKEISEELVVKETRQYKRQQVLSERFCKLLPFIVEVDEENIEEFYSTIEIKYSKKGNAYLDETNKLSGNDLLLLYVCYVDNNLILVTEDKYLLNAANHMVGKGRVMTLKQLLENEIIIDKSN